MEGRELTVLGRSIPYSAVAIFAASVILGGVLAYRYKRSPVRPPKIVITPENSAEFFLIPPKHDLQYRNVDGHLAQYSVMRAHPNARLWVKDELDNGKSLDPQTDRAIAVLVGNVIGDALGAPFEFSPVEYGTSEMKEGFEEADIWLRRGYNTFRLKPGQWTDDASMGLCLADSLIVQDGFEPRDLRLRFLNWWRLGYNNAFGYDSSRYPGSVGLGGNISMSMREFAEEQNEYTQMGDKNTSGNGSIMRNGPIPIFYYSAPKEALEFAYKQSKTTHQGEEAAECCRLLTFICIKAIGLGKGATPVSVLEDLSDFSSPLYSVQCIAGSKTEENVDNNPKFNPEDRNWNWKDPNFRFSPTRARNQPGYIGSYSMDGLAMALHCIWSTTSFKGALIKCANLRGDSDSVCAVVGQIAGAIYGYGAIPPLWIKTVRTWDPEGDIQARAYKLWQHNDLLPTHQWQ